MIKVVRLLVLLFFAVSLTDLHAADKKVYTYQHVDGDPLNARIYRLDNGLTVYLSVYKDAPRIQTAIAVRAGSKNDPSDATGLAHYLEHMLFKGTDRYGSLDYAKEKPELDKIEVLYESYRATKEAAKRKAIYHQIDSVSGVAAKYAIANEYDKMLSSIGAKGTNAFTSFEQTVYVNDVPSNQLEKWLTIEAERFRQPVLRIFHTELEAVYEEKNRGLDNDDWQLWETLYAGLFQKNTYGTQTTIGTIDHLKNPSITKIKKFYDVNYVPNNMAICLSGDMDPDSTIAWIDARFGGLKSKALTPFIPAVEAPIMKPVVRDIYGPAAEQVMIGFRFPGAGTADAELLELTDMILCNGKAGLLDLNLNQKQKVLSSGTSVDMLKDYTVHSFFGSPREGQKLEDVKKLMLAQIDSVKKGAFPDWLMQAAINDLKLRQIHNYESNYGRMNAMLESFILGINWSDRTQKINRLSKITKQQIVDFANKNYNDNYVVVYKHTGENKNAQKVEKPAITPVEVNRESRSPFVQAILNTPAAESKPVFLNYDKDIVKRKLDNGIPLNYLRNTENNTFSLYYIVEMGGNSDRKLGVALDYLKYLGTKDLSPEALQQEFYRLGCSFDVNSSNDQIYVSLTGLSDNFEPSVKLFEKLLKDPKADKPALDNLVTDLLKSRTDSKLNKDQILWSGLYNYGHYGAKSPFTNILSETELKALDPKELTAIISGLTSYEHHILYYGPTEVEPLMASLLANHPVPAIRKPLIPEQVFSERETSDSIVYIVNYDMKQAEIIMLSKGGIYSPNLYSDIRLYNEYFGGGMSSIVFQDIRESKALAYSVFSNYQTPSRPDAAFYNMAYIGTQADKLPEAMTAMYALLNKMPESQVAFASAKEAIKNKIETERITRASILFNYERAVKFGLNHDARKDLYEQLPAMNYDAVSAFQSKYIKGSPYILLVLGDKNLLDLNTLQKYGKIKYLSLEDIFGY